MVIAATAVAACSPSNAAQPGTCPTVNAARVELSFNPSENYSPDKVSYYPVLATLATGEYIWVTMSSHGTYTTFPASRSSTVRRVCTRNLTSTEKLPNGSTQSFPTGKESLFLGVRPGSAKISAKPIPAPVETPSFPWQGQLLVQDTPPETTSIP